MSIVTLISSAICVVFVIHLIIVPQMQLQAHAVSMCTITHLQVTKHQPIIDTHAVYGTEQDIPYVVMNRTGSRQDCVEVTAKFIDINGNLVFGNLILSRFGSVDIHALTAKVCELCLFLLYFLI